MAASEASEGHPQHHHYHLPHLPHYNLRKTGQRLRHLLHPDGRKVHIAQNPAEAEELKRTLSQDDDEIEIFIHGSDEHLEALRAIHAHHDQRRSELRQQHGHLFEQAEAACLELEALSEELRQVTDRSVAFDANFSRFGYSATLRTHGETSQPHSSSVSLIGGGGKTDQQALDDWHQLKFQGQALKPWRKPIVRQYFHKGLLWRAQDEEQTASYELFLDLIYVGIIAISGENAAEEHNGEALLRFTTTFIMGWKVWFDLVQMMNWFDQDDVWRRFYVLFELACLVGFTANISYSDEATYTPLVSFYLAARLATAMYFACIAYFIPMIRWALLEQTGISILAVAIWIGSVHVEYPAREGLIWPAIVLDLFGPFFVMTLNRVMQSAGVGAEKLKKAFEFYPATNIEHRIDRTGSFVTLVFGHTVLSLLYSSTAHIGVNAFLGKAILGLCQAFCLNTLYFEIDSFNLHTHAIRRHVLSTLAWMTLHLPMILTFVLAGAALAKMVVTDDVPGTHAYDLAYSSASHSEDHLSPGLRWFYTAGLGIGLLCLNGIAITHVYRDIHLSPGTRIPFLFKRPIRILYRSLVALAIIFLGFVEHLNSLKLIALTTGLILSACVVEFIGNMLTGCQRHLKRRRSDLSGTTIGSDAGSTHKVGLKDWWRAMRTECCREGKCHYRARVHGGRKATDRFGGQETPVTVEELAGVSEKGGAGVAQLVERPKGDVVGGDKVV